MAVIDVRFDFAQVHQDLFMGPTFEGSAQIDTDDFSQYTGVDTFGIVRWKCHVHFSLRCSIHCSVIRQRNFLVYGASEP